MVTASLTAIGDHFYNFPWFLLPVEHQLLFLPPIQRSQSAYRLKGLGMVECSLRVYSAVRRGKCDSSIKINNNHIIRILFPSTDYTKSFIVFHCNAEFHVTGDIPGVGRLLEESTHTFVPVIHRFRILDHLYPRELFAFTLHLLNHPLVCRKYLEIPHQLF